MADYEDEFYAALGRAVAQWQFVEENLLYVFAKLTGCPDPLTAGATFYAILSFQGKLAMTHAAAQQTLKDGELLQQWNQLQEDLAKEARNRNKLVHLTTIFDPSEKRGYLIYPYLDPRKRSILKESMLSGSMDIERINELTEIFAQLAVRLEGFTPKIDASIPLPGKPQ